MGVSMRGFPGLGLGVPVIQGMKVELKKLPGLRHGETRMILRSLVLRHYQHVTDGRTDRHAASSIAERDET